MSTFIGGNSGEVIEPGFVSSTVKVIGGPKKPSDAADLIFAGSGDDRVAGGGGNDIAFLGAGNDTFIWNAGDGRDIVSGGSGNDALLFNGANSSDDIDICAGIFGIVGLSRNGNLNIVLTEAERIDVRALAGADSIAVHDLSGSGIVEVNIDLGGAGDPAAGDGMADRVSVEGTHGGDTIEVLGNGSSVIVAGLAALVRVDRMEVADSLDIDGRGGDDLFAVSGARITIKGFHAGAGSQDRIDLRAVAGASNLDWVLDHAVNVGGSAVLELGNGGQITLANVAVASLHADDFLFAAPAPTLITVNGTDGDDVIAVAVNGTVVEVSGLAATVVVDPAVTEELVVAGLGGNDTISAGPGLAALLQLTLDGGTGNDTLSGGDGADQLLGGDGNDSVDGNQGADVAFLGAGDDTFAWDPGDGSDISRGRGRQSTPCSFNGSAGAEILTVSANGDRALLHAQPGQHRRWT